MSKLLAIVAALKPILIAASAVFARGDMLPVLLISALFCLTSFSWAQSRSVRPYRLTSSLTILSLRPKAATAK